MNLKRTLRLRAAKRSPEAFRKNLVISQNIETHFGELLEDWQREDFAALDSMWSRLAGATNKARYQRAFIERPRGHSKTTDMASQIAWILQNSKRRLNGMAAAADREQASLIRDSVERLAKWNPDLCSDLVFQKNQVLNRKTGSRMVVISSDVQSSWGALPDFVICDELCHWEKRELWESLLSSAAKQPHCVLVILTNAGVGRGWQWDLREAARSGKNWYFSSLVGTQAGWISKDDLEDQKRLLPSGVFARLWLNEWQHSDGAFVTLDEARACRDENLKKQQRGEPGRNYIAAIDFASKHDYTVGVLVHRKGNVIVVDRMDVVVPSEHCPTEVQWVSDWMQRMVRDFGNVKFIIDEYQLLGTIQQFERTMDVRRFEFGAGKGNHALAVALRKLILHREVKWYSGCGLVSDNDDLEMELASVLLRQSVNGRCRIDHLKDGVHHDDRAFALGVACLSILESGTEPEWMEVDGVFL